MGQKKQFIKVHIEKWNFYIFICLLLFISCGYCSIMDENSDVALFKRETTNNVDPHSFYYNKHSKTEIKMNSLSVENEKSVMQLTSYQHCNRCRDEKMTDIPDEFFSRRIVNLLLSQVNFENDEDDDDSFHGMIAIKITAPQLEKLKSFGMGQYTIRDMDSIISNIFRTPKKHIFHDVSYYVNHFFIQAYMNKDIVIGVLVTLYLTWIILTTRWSMLKLVGIAIMIVLAASFIISWLQLIKEAEIKHIVKQMAYVKLPSHCQPSQMSWSDQLWSIFSSTESCHKYYESRMENPFLQVTPVQALFHMIATCILKPAKLLGKALGEFSHHATEHLFAPVRLIAEPLLIVGILALLIFTIFWLAYRFFTPYSLFSWIVNGRSTNHMNINDKERREPIEVILSVKMEHNVQAPQLAIKASTQNNDADIASECITQTKNEITNNSLTLVQDEKSHSHINSASGDSNSLNCRLRFENDKLVETHNSTIDEIIPESGSGDN